MAHVLLVYTSMTGNTQEMAEAIAEGVQANQSVQLIEMDLFDSFPNNLDIYDCIIIGCYTDGEGDIPDEMLDLYDEIEDYDLSKKVVGLFGSGDTCYDYFCGALDKLEQQIRRSRAYLPLSSLKIDVVPSNKELEACKQFGQKLVEYVFNSRCI